jgi:hypothetical protein
METLPPCPKATFPRSIGSQGSAADRMSASCAVEGRNKRRQRSLLLLLCLASVPASIASAALASATENLVATLRCEVATIAALMAARHRRRGLFGPMFGKTAL